MSNLDIRLKNRYRATGNLFRCDMAHYLRAGIGKSIPVNWVFGLKKGVCIIGLAFGLAWILTFLGLWVYRTGIQDNSIVTFQEQNPIIKYSEWILGLLAAVIIIKQIKSEVDKCISTE